MLVAPHVAAGVTLGLALQQPLLIAPLALGSHFLLDSVPHWQETMAPYKPTWKTYVRIPIDLGIGVLLVWLAIRIHPDLSLAIGTGVFFATVPDSDVLTIIFPSLKTKVISRYWDWHCAIQREVTSAVGVATQLIVLAIGFVTIYTI